MEKSNLKTNVKVEVLQFFTKGKKEQNQSAVES